VPLPAGTRLGPYEVLTPLGAGGMGEVYRARDERLGRDVAIKVLPEAVRVRPDRLLRFEKEARAAGALNHPGILDVHDVGTHEGLPYLVFELLEGRTLRDSLAAGPLAVSKARDLALQIARGLAAAHDKGIVHCDLKPANVFVTTDGRAKILDFGLARLEEIEPGQDGESADMTEATTAPTATGRGKLAGTVGYMSPEQVRGDPIDHRSDIFAFGCLLYEMLTGHRAFRGKTTPETLAAILHDDPAGLAGPESGLSGGLRTLISRCLEKRPEERFQSARDLAFALEAASASGETWRPTEAASSPDRPRGPRSRRAFWAAAAVSSVAVVMGILSRMSGAPTTGALAWTSRQLTSDPGWEAEPALSPDGTLVAFSSDRSGNPDIWVLDARGGTPLRLTDDAANDRSPAWFPDGSAVAFVSDRAGAQAIWKVSRLGGASELLLQDAESPAVSPDGSRLAFRRRDASGTHRILVAPLADLARARMLTTEADGLWDHDHPAWSPDGNTLCYADARDLWLVRPEGGSARRLTREGATDSHPAWSPDGHWIYFSSFRSGSSALWRIATRGGAPERITLGTGPEGEPNLAVDPSRIAYSTFLVNPDVVILDTKTGETSRVPGLREEWEPTFAPDGSRLVFSSERSGSFDLWVQPLDEGRAVGEPIRLTEQPGSESVPAFSPDGRWIAYGRVLDGQRDVWVVSSTGGPPRRITHHPGVDIQPAWSPDGMRLAFVSNRDGTHHVWVSHVADGGPAGTPVQLTSGPATDRFPAWSPDGSVLAFLRDIGAETEVWLVPTHGDGPARQITRGSGARYLRWERTRGSLLVSGTWGSTVVSLRRLALPDGEALPLDRPLVAREGDLGALIGVFDISGDGRHLAYVMEEVRGDVWILEP